ncbi:teichoic acid D-Ala incorporation-associated protein DltX [Streptococcus urinalis]|uniref:D-Ala-teichoic acid biosynthesis protein n=1 Tax=Streptococcus urinalis 2285-97 TaxID=764291 RepID=G5KHE1_9STRE|nr:teichoic acid D-Ala incorporation-associated protein DltX [Streptococcus urinalis]EHJ56837.1 D-Ala-teichoic acid biosynthesis protein [Streptococcus urinalis 2285-97]
MLKKIKNSKYTVFIGKVILFYVIFLLLLYFFGYAGHGQATFIYNEF